MHMTAPSILGDGGLALWALLGLSSGTFSLQQLLKSSICLIILLFPLLEFTLSFLRLLDFLHDVLTCIIMSWSYSALNDRTLKTIRPGTLWTDEQLAILISIVVLKRKVAMI
jgi:hypothetical protein